jgi:glyoxylase-like metal-dependent hydrolase (beta-lactamase superfamily II)
VESREDRLSKKVDAEGKALSSEGMKEAEAALRGKQQVLAELRDFTYLAPTLTFDPGLEVDLGNRLVQMSFLGRGETGGEAVVYLPKEKIVAVGELVTTPVPYTFAGYPSEWVRTLNVIDSMDVDTIVPGHGEVLRGKAFLELQRDLLKSAVNQVYARMVALAAITETPSFEDVRKGVDLSSFRERFAHASKEQQEFFDQASSILVRVAYNEARRNSTVPKQ